MNEFIVAATVTQDPQLRYTPDNQTAVAEMWIEFPGLRDDDPVSSLKVTGWGNLAQEMQQSYHRGDRVIVEGRLGMNSVDRQEGFKEKRAELTARRIHRMNADATLSTVSAAPVQPSAEPKAAPAPKGTSQSTAPVKPPIGKRGQDNAPGRGKDAARPPARTAAGARAGGASDPDPTYDEIPFMAPGSRFSMAGDDPIDFVAPDFSRSAVGFEFGKF